MTLARLALLATLFSAPVFAALSAGDAAPDFKAQASLAGKEFEFSLAKALQQGTVVVYFYPAAYTQGCNIQAHEIATRYDEFTAAGATVIGVSTATPSVVSAGWVLVTSR